MIEDPIVEEIRLHRKAHTSEHGNDLERIVQSLRKRERESDRPLLNPGPKEATKPNRGLILSYARECGKFQRVTQPD